MCEAPDATAAPYVLLVVGRPASGKSTVSRAIAERWNLPVVSKDALKELLFDSLGVVDRDWSRRLGQAAFSLLDHVIELQLRAGKPFLVDAAYDARYENARFRAWQRKYGFTAVQVHCVASHEELVRRFAERAAGGARHPGHADHDAVEEFQTALDDGREEVLDLDGPVLRYDTEQRRSAEGLLRELATLLPSVSSGVGITWHGPRPLGP
jgi:Predicted kinase